MGPATDMARERARVTTEQLRLVEVLRPRSPEVGDVDDPTREVSADLTGEEHDRRND